MNITILGYKLRVELILLCVLLYWFINVNTFFSCAGGVKPGVKVLKEGFAVGGNLMEGLTDATANAAADALAAAKKKGEKDEMEKAMKSASMPPMPMPKNLSTPK
jgi:hypothetical protein